MMIRHVGPTRQSISLLEPTRPRGFLCLPQHDAPMSQHGRFTARVDHGDCDLLSGQWPVRVIGQETIQSLTNHSPLTTSRLPAATVGWLLASKTELHGIVTSH